MPSQWDGELADGRVFYGRYRWSSLELGIGKTRDEAVRDRDALDGPPDHSGGFDGDMSNDDFMRYTAGVLDWSRAFSVVDTTGWPD